jgi:hypothetical protein
LSAISVFDADCAAVHLKSKNEVAFRPFGLDVPDELGTACKQVRSRLDAEKKLQEAASNAIFTTPPWKPTRAVGKALAALTYKTDVATLEKLATLSEPEQARLTRLTEDLSKNPATAAAEQTLKADRIKHLGEALAVIATGTADDVLSHLLALHRDAAAKRAAARLAALGLFGTDCLPDVAAKYGARSGKQHAAIRPRSLIRSRHSRRPSRTRSACFASSPFRQRRPSA